MADTPIVSDGRFGIGTIMSPGGTAPAPMTLAEAQSLANDMKSVEFKNRLFSGDKIAHAQLKQVQEVLQHPSINVIGGNALAEVDRQQEEHNVMGRTRQADWAMREFDIPAEHQKELVEVLEGKPVPRALRDAARVNVEKWQKLPAYQNAMNKNNPAYADAAQVELRRKLGAARILSVAQIQD